MNHFILTELKIQDAASILNILVLTITLLFIIRYTAYTKRANVSQAYFSIVKSLQSRRNNKQVSKLKENLNYYPGKVTKIKSWSPESVKIAKDITNRYQIVAHLVQRKFIIKKIFLENFSGTSLDIWNLCSPYISKARRKNCEKSRYLRRDLEILSLQSWIYQYSLGYNEPLITFDENNRIVQLMPTRENIFFAKHLLKKYKRKPLWIS